MNFPVFDRMQWSAREMTALGMILLLVGGMALLGGILQKMRAGRLGDTPFAPTGQVAANGRQLANAKGTISTQGQIQTQELLTSPVSAAQCVYYRMRLDVEWGDNNAQQKHLVHEEFKSVPFAVNDGSGHVVISIDPKRGGEFCSAKPFTRKKFSRGLMATMTAKPLEVTPTFSIPAQVQVPGAFGKMIDVPLTASYFVTEEYLEPKGPIYVNGKVQDDGSIGSPSWTSLLIMDKSRDELLASTTGFAKKLLLGGGIVTPIGAIFAIIGALTNKTPPPSDVVVAPNAMVADGAVAPGADPTVAPGTVPGVAPGDSALVSQTLQLSGACAGLDLTHGLVRVNDNSDGINVTAIQGSTFNRLYLKLGNDIAPGTNIDVCALGRRCNMGLQMNVGMTVFINTGRTVSGSITVNQYDRPSGHMNVTFNNVTIPVNQGAGQCTLNGGIVTTGLSS